MIAPRGPGALAARARLSPGALIRASPQLSVPVVSRYTHLGSRIHMHGRMGPALARRSQQAMVTVRHLRAATNKAKLKGQGDLALHEAM
eukprot:1635405-Lingulodinium_polyedra.AAC.1